jgi:hypothetical protein
VNPVLWRFAGEGSFPGPPDLKIFLIEGINPFRYNWVPAGYSIVVPDPKGGKRFYHMQVYLLYSKTVPIHEQVAITFAAGVISDSFWVFYFPSAPDVAGAFEASVPRYEGFWRQSHNEESELPWPEPQPGWLSAPEFLRALKRVEEVAERIQYRGLSRCRLCGCVNGDSSFRLQVWEWPEGFKHYVADHNVRPSQEFAHFILDSSM